MTINTIKAIARKVISIMDINVKDYIAPSTHEWTVKYATKIAATSNTHVPMI